MFTIAGDGYGSGTGDPGRSGNLYAPTTSATSLMNMNPTANISTSQRTNPLMVVNQSNLHNTDQPANMKPSINQSDDMDFQSQNLMNSQPSLQYQQQLVRSQRQQKQQNQVSPYGQSQSRSQLVSDFGTQIKSEPNETSQTNIYDNLQSSQPTNSFMQINSGSQFGVDTRNNVTSSIGGQWQSRSQETSNQLGSQSNELNIQAGFHHGTMGHDKNHKNNILSTVPSANLDRERFRMQAKWLLILMHARYCGFPRGNCLDKYCIQVQDLVNHMLSCNDGPQCQYARCAKSKGLLNHKKHCKDQNCPVCVTVNHFVQIKGTRRTNFPQSSNGLHDYTVTVSPSVVETSEDLHPSMKRMKIEAPSQPPTSKIENPLIPAPISSTSEVLPDRDPCPPIKYEVTAVKMEVPKITEVRKDYVDDSTQNNGVSAVSNEATGFPKQEFFTTETEVGPAKQENVGLVGETSSGTKSGKPKIKGVSMIELFTPEQVQEHIDGLRQWVGQVRYLSINFLV